MSWNSLWKEEVDRVYNRSWGHSTVSPCCSLWWQKQPLERGYHKCSRVQRSVSTRSVKLRIDETISSWYTQIFPPVIIHSAGWRGVWNTWHIQYVRITHDELSVSGHQYLFVNHTVFSRVKAGIAFTITTTPWIRRKLICIKPVFTQRLLCASKQTHEMDGGFVCTCLCVCVSTVGTLSTAWVMCLPPWWGKHIWF